MREWKAGDRCKLDGLPARVLCTCGEWAWVIKDRDPENPETVSLILLKE